MLNAYWEPLEFELPPLSSDAPAAWRRVIDTSLESPHDISPWTEAPVVETATYKVQDRSIVLLIAANGNSGAA